MSTIYITQPGTTIRKINERVRVTANREVIVDVPLIKVSQIVILGRATVTGASVSALMRRNIEICYLNKHGEYIGRLQPEWSNHGGLRRAQYRAADDPQRCLDIAKAVAAGKLNNLKTLLQRRKRQYHIQELEPAVKRIKTAIARLDEAANLDVVRGCEGDGSAAYFAVFTHLLSTPEFSFPKRTRRPPTDPVNALLSFGYTLLANNLLAATHIVGFDPYTGFLHGHRYGRPSLALDLMEEFRPLIVDMMVLRCLNQHKLTLEDFVQKKTGATCRLTDEGRKKFLLYYEQRKLTEFTHPGVQQKMTYLQSFEQQTRLLAHVVQGEADVYQPLSLPG